IVVLVHGFQCNRIGCLDSAEDRAEEGLAHSGKNFRTLGDVERCLAREPQDEAGPSLPFCEMRQDLERGLAIADEIVVDKVDRSPDAAFKHPVEFGYDLLRRLQARIAAIESRDIAEFALIRTAARILDAAEEIARQLREFVSGDRKARHVDK